MYLHMQEIELVLDTVIQSKIQPQIQKDLIQNNILIIRNKIV